MKFAPLILVLLLIAACASPPEPRFRDPNAAEWEAADFGDMPTGYDAAIRTFLEGLLQNPRSTTLTFKEGPAKTWAGSAPDVQYGYGVCVEMVERGVYTAANFGPTFFLLHNDRVMLMREGSDGERLCARLGRMPDGVAN